jgi:hypothetical protein
MDRYLQEQASSGTFESEGGFTLDLAKAADKLAAFALPSEFHYLLKMVQVAHRLEAEKIEVKIERFRTVVRFRTPTGGTITDTEAIYGAFADPLKVKDPVMVDLVSGLLGTLTDENIETLWSYSQGHSGRRVFIDKKRTFSIQDFTLTKPLAPDAHPCAFTLSVLHQKTWMFWKGGKRRAGALKVLEDHCKFSAAVVTVDNRALGVSESSVVREHLVRRVYQQGSGFWRVISLPAINILYEMARPDKPKLAIKRPSLSAYVVRNKNLNLWASGTRVNNTLRPDGHSSASWMLQFVSQGESLSMRCVPKRITCEAVLAVNESVEGEETPLRIKIIRSGVTVLEQSMEAFAEELKPLQDCVLIFADDCLETDLTGFQVIQDAEFVARLLSHGNLLSEARRYIERGRELLTM